MGTQTASPGETSLLDIAVSGTVLRSACPSAVSIYCVLGLSLDTRYVCWGDLSDGGTVKTNMRVDAESHADPSATRHIIQVGLVSFYSAGEAWGSHEASAWS